MQFPALSPNFLLGPLHSAGVVLSISETSQPSTTHNVVYWAGQRSPHSLIYSLVLSATKHCGQQGGEVRTGDWQKQMTQSLPFRSSDYHLGDMRVAVKSQYTQYVHFRNANQFLWERESEAPSPPWPVHEPWAVGVLLESGLGVWCQPSMCSLRSAGLLCLVTTMCFA